MSLSLSQQAVSRRKILASVASALGASSLLAACGGGGGSAAATSAPAAAAPTTAAQPAAPPPTAAPAAPTAVPAAPTTAPQPTTAAVQPTAAPVAAAGKKVELTYWHIFGGTDTPTMNAIVDNLNKAHPDITVKPARIGFYPTTGTSCRLSRRIACRSSGWSPTASR